MKKPRQNAIWQYALMTAPVIVCTNNLWNGLVLCFMIDLMLIPAALFCRLLPKRMPYGLRILSYSLTAALVYIPIGMAAEFLFPAVSLGICLPLLTMSVILMLRHADFSSEEKLLQCISVLTRHILCLDIGILVMSMIREILGTGTFFGIQIQKTGMLSSFGTPALGMILLGCLGALGRYSKARIRWLQKEASGDDESAD